MNIGIKRALVKFQMSIQRQAMSIMTSLFAIFPDLETRLSCRAATSLISTMAIAGMFLPTDCPYQSRGQELLNHVTAGINYELSILAIARSLGIDGNTASTFIRSCFASNKLELLYPFVDTVFGLEYEHIARHTGTQLAQYVVEYLAGDQYMCAGDDNTPQKKSKHGKVSASKQKTYGTFFLLSDFIKIKDMSADLPMKLYFLEVIEFIQSHPDRRIPKNELTSKKIFIDEIIDYAREYDESRFEQFRDEIGDLLLTLDDHSTLPDCQSLKSKLNLFKLNANIKTFKEGFANFMRSENKVADEPATVPDADADAELVQEIAPENTPALLPNIALTPKNNVSNTPIIIRRITHAGIDLDQQFEEDTARAIHASLESY